MKNLLEDLFGSGKVVSLPPNADVAAKGIANAAEPAAWKGIPNEEIIGNRKFGLAGHNVSTVVVVPPEGSEFGSESLNFAWGTADGVTRSDADVRTPTAMDVETRTSNRPYDNRLEERGYLAFNYAFDPNTGGTESTTRILPFFETPQISESRMANYVNSKIYLRNDMARLYTYTKPRKIILNFHMTVPHVAEYFRGNWEWLKKKSASEGFTPVTDVGEKEIEAYLDAIVAWDVSQQKSVDDIPQPASVSGIAGETKMGEIKINDFNEYMYKAATFPTKKMHQVMDFLHYAVNHIRSSVINSGGERISGPPIVMLKHGSLYNNIPCIVKQYKISVQENAGYETRTLFPNRVKINMTLEEMRGMHGNLHTDNSVVAGDLPGWASVHSLGHIDPVRNS